MYRDKAEIHEWSTMNNPISRFIRHLRQRNQWPQDAEEKKIRDQMRSMVLIELLAAEKRKKPPISQMFTDVYGGEGLPKNLQLQRDELFRLMEEYPDEFKFASDFEPEP